MEGFSEEVQGFLLLLTLPNTEVLCITQSEHVSLAVFVLTFKLNVNHILFILLSVVVCSLSSVYHRLHKVCVKSTKLQ